jgi:hypothetical protein
MERDKNGAIITAAPISKKLVEDLKQRGYLFF